jgi:hypothetical protein
MLLKRYSQGLAYFWIERIDGSVTIDNQTIKAKCQLMGNQILQLDSAALAELFTIKGANVE